MNEEIDKHYHLDNHHKCLTCGWIGNISDTIKSNYEYSSKNCDLCPECCSSKLGHINSESHDDNIITNTYKT